MSNADELESLRLASRLVKSGRAEEALELLEKLTQSIQVRMKRGDALHALKRFKEAADQFYEALQLRPDAEIASISRFLSLAFSGNFHSAVEEMEVFLQQFGSEEYINVCLDFPTQFDAYFEWANLDDYPSIKKKLAEAAARGPGNFVETDRPVFDYIDINNHLR